MDQTIDDSLAQEIPLFAAEGSIAYRRGGAVTRDFLERLPAEWQKDHLVVDSMLVWLQKGQSLLTRWFHHEVYPGKNEWAYAAANDERGVEHIACAAGVPSVREFLVGAIPAIDTTSPGFDLYRTANKDYPLRHQFLRDQRDAGRLAAVTIGMGTMHRYAWGAFQRVIATETSGYHFWIRATRGSVRPIVNGLRNIATPNHIGPWVTNVENGY